MTTQPPTELHSYQCGLCKTWMTTTVKARYWECNSCDRRWMKFQYSTPITTDEHRQIAAKGTHWGPWKPQTPTWTCHRCGEAFTSRAFRWRVDGQVCIPCAKAEEGPPKPLLTKAQAEAERARYEALIADDIDRQEAAYQAAEGASK